MIQKKSKFYTEIWEKKYNQVFNKEINSKKTKI